MKKLQSQFPGEVSEPPETSEREVCSADADCRALGMSRDRPGPSQGASGPARRPWLHGPEAPHRWRRLASGSGLSLI